VHKGNFVNLSWSTFEGPHALKACHPDRAQTSECVEECRQLLVTSSFDIGGQVALAAGLLATPQRRSLLQPWVYLGALLAGVMVVPNLLWQQAHGWPFIELGKAGSSVKNLEIAVSVLLTTSHPHRTLGDDRMAVRTVDGDRST
jgi:hypothetical protein